MKKLTQLFISAAVVIGVGAALLPAGSAAAADLDPCTLNPNSTMCKDQGLKVDDLIKNIIQILLFIIGVVAVIMLIWGGIRYTTSGGNQAAVTSAKNIIMYAIIGLVVAIFAFAIVNFVYNQSTKKPAPSQPAATSNP